MLIKKAKKGRGKTVSQISCLSCRRFASSGPSIGQLPGPAVHHSGITRDQDWFSQPQRGQSSHGTFYISSQQAPDQTVEG